MALATLGLPIFSGGAEEDLLTFIDLYIGYLNSVGINILGAGPPTGRQRGMGILRSCMRGTAADWFDKNLTGKNWKIAYIRSAGGANMAGLRGLTIQEGPAGPNIHVGTYVPGSSAAIFAADPLNAGANVG